MTRSEVKQRLKENKVYFGESLLINQKTGKKIKFWDYQKKDLISKSNELIHQDGRETGKTEMLLPTRVLHSIGTKPRGRTLLIAPQETHLAKALSPIEFQLRSELLSCTFNGNIKRKPHYEISFYNGHVFNAAVAGPRGDQLRGFHADTVIVDEGGLMTQLAWAAAGGCINEGATLTIYGVPTGIRSSSYYRFTTEGKFELHKCPSWLAPTFTEEKHNQKIDFYGGKDTPEYQHEVAAEHGSPAYGVYNTEDMADCLSNYPYLKLSICGDDLSENKEYEIDSIVSQIKNHCGDRPLFIGADLGYSADPAETTFHEKRGLVIRTIVRLHLEHIKYTDQAEIFKRLYGALNILGIGIDQGNNGLAVCQILLEDIPGIEEILYPIAFGGTILIDPINEIKEYTKKHMTTLQLGAIQRREWEIPGENGNFKDSDFECQYAEHTYTTGQNGRVVYKKGNDHIIDADRCAFYARWADGTKTTNGGFYF